MVYRMATLFLAVLALALFVGGPALADDTHEGKFVSAKGNDFTMDLNGKEHTHTLAPGAVILNADGKAVKLTDLTRGQKIKVTTKTGDKRTATKIEVVKEKK